jgi:DnaD/phage-associated family protein
MCTFKKGDGLEVTGYVKDYRKELISDIWKMPPLYHRVWQYLKYKVNHTFNKIPMTNGESFNISPGQHLTAYRTIAQGVGYYEKLKWKEPNTKTISTILSWLEKQQMITIDHGNRQYTLITLINWDFYQSKSNDGNSKVTPGGKAVEHLMGINNNDKECFNNDNNDNKNKKIKTATKELSLSLPSKINVAWNDSMFPPLLPNQSKELLLFVDKLSEELVIKAIQIARAKEILSFEYVEGILKRFVKAGFKTEADVNQSEQVRKQNQNSFERTVRVEMVPEWFKKNKQIKREQSMNSAEIAEERERLKRELAEG